MDHGMFGWIFEINPELSFQKVLFVISKAGIETLYTDGK